MELKHLRYFVAVADAGSVGKAAMQLHMAQPPLSVHIRNLETQLGTALFRRGSGGMELTDAGGALYSRAKEALALAHDGFEAARAVAAGRLGRLTVGYMFALGYAVLPKLVPELRRTLPGVDIHFVERQIRRLEPLVVAHHAILIQQFTLGRAGRNLPCGMRSEHRNQHPKNRMPHHF